MEEVEFGFVLGVGCCFDCGDFGFVDDKGYCVGILSGFIGIVFFVKGDVGCDDECCFVLCCV